MFQKSDRGNLKLRNLPICLQISSFLTISTGSASSAGSADSTANKVESRSCASTFTITFESSTAFGSATAPLVCGVEVSSTKFEGKRPENFIENIFRIFFKSSRKKYKPVLPLSSPSHQFGSDCSISVIISPVLKVSSLSSAASKSYRAFTCFLPESDGAVCSVE